MKPQIPFDIYAQVEVRAGRIIEATVPAGSEKLIQFTVDFGDEKRTIFSGIKQWYSADELVGVTTIWVTNIPSRKTPFGDSMGMLFACDASDGKPYIVRLSDDVPLGSTFH